MLSRREVWQDFREYKTQRNRLSRKELAELDSFLREERYHGVTDTFHFSYPKKIELTKLNSSKKRTVYTYTEDETWVLKLLAFLLYRYDGKTAGSCYSFRRNMTSKTAFDRIRRIDALEEKYALKLDIHDYFNSIDTEQLIGVTEQIIDDDERLVDFLSMLLRQNRCVWEGEVIEEDRGAMAGVPLASFFANIYLRDLDLEFEEKGIPYFRYSDDMIMFLDSMNEVDRAFNRIKEVLEKKELELNMDKFSLTLPGGEWEFLGFRYKQGRIDLAEGTIEKMKGRIKRKAQSLYRQKKRKGYSFEKAARSMISSFDHRFYDINGNNSFTWTRFYFPVITSTEGLHEIDRYMLEYLRFLNSGRHYKGNYRITYEQLKKLGYTPLVSEYYNWKEENETLNRSREE